MLRLRAVLTLMFLSGFYFLFLLVQQIVIDKPTSLFFIPLLTLLLALLTLLISPRGLFLYAMIVIIIGLFTGALEVFRSDVSFPERIMIASGVTVFSTTLVVFISRLRDVQWIKVQRFSQNSENPWVALDRGQDPTIEFDKEDQ